MAAKKDRLVDGGEMGQVIRSMDWSQTPLVPRESWPQSLRTTVSLCLAFNFPIAIAWRPQYTQIYNDGYWPICGAKHPHSMGQDLRECWATAFPVIGKVPATLRPCRAQPALPGKHLRHGPTFRRTGFEAAVTSPSPQGSLCRI